MTSIATKFIVPRTGKGFLASLAITVLSAVAGLFLSIFFLIFAVFGAGLILGLLASYLKKIYGSRQEIVSALDSVLSIPLYAAFMLALLDVMFYAGLIPLAFLIMEGSFVFILLSVLSIRHSTKLYRSSNYILANYFRKSSGYLFILAVSVFLFLDFYTSFLAAPMFMFSLSAILGETGGILKETSTTNLKTLGIYLKENQRRIGRFFIFLGLVLDILLIPKPAIYNDYVLAFFLFLAAVFALRSVHNSYKISILLMELSKEEPFSKHVYYPKSVRDENIDFLVGDAREFLLEGNTNGLLVSLAFILTKYGYDFQKIKQVLEAISSYRKPEVIYSRGDLTRDIIRNEMEKRRHLLDIAMQSIAGE